MIALGLTAVLAIFVVSSTLGRAIYEGQSPGLLSFAGIHFAGYLFFLLMPVEALVPIYEAEGHAGEMLIAIAVGTALLAQAIDYAIGRAFSDQVIDNMIGQERFDRFHARIDRWGGAAIFVFNLFPLSSPNMLLVAGIVQYSAFKALVISAAGLLAKYAAIVYLVDISGFWSGAGP